MPAAPEPGESSWIRAYRKGSVVSPLAFATRPQFAGWFTADAVSVATNFDVLIDWADTGSNGVGLTFIAAIWAVTAPGTPKLYRGSYSLTPIGGVTPVASPTGNTPSPLWSTCVQCGVPYAGTSFLMQAGGIAACQWGVDVAMLAIGGGQGVSNLIMGGIAHGREL